MRHGCARRAAKKRPPGGEALVSRGLDIHALGQQIGIGEGVALGCAAAIFLHAEAVPVNADDGGLCVLHDLGVGQGDVQADMGVMLVQGLNAGLAAVDGFETRGVCPEESFRCNASRQERLTIVRTLRPAAVGLGEAGD